VIQLFRDLNSEQGITVILVTHDLDVARVAKRIIVLRDGLVVKDTTDYVEAMQYMRVGDMPTSSASEIEPVRE
jgi:putative ABC transport system ATP-binding protein